MQNQVKQTPAAGVDGTAVPFSDRSCSNCQFWAERYEYTGRWTAKGKREVSTDGDCRIRPPRAINKDLTAVWPRTEAGDWCARWVLREEDAE